MTPNTFATFILLAWPLAMGFLTILLPVRKIVILSIIGGNLFLPQTGIALPGFPNYTKPLAAGLGALLAAFIFASPKLFSWRPKPIDLFFFAFILAPGISSYSNQLGTWDTTSVIVNRFLEWGVAYWVGRALFQDQDAIKEIAIGFVIAGIIYTPLCIWESVMSPQLSMNVYGFRPSAFGMTVRMGGFRPMVFMQHGLALSAWMASTALVAWILWRSKAITRIKFIPMSMIAIGLVVVTIGLRSAGAAVLLLGLIAAVELVQFTKLKVALLILILLPTGYITMRATGWDGNQILNLTSFLGEDRSQSLNMRLENDTMITQRALQHPVFGWGGWGRWRIFDDLGNDITVSDSWWAILLGSTGLFGLTAAYGTFIAPMLKLTRRKTGIQTFDATKGTAWAIGFAILLFVLDTLVNAMPNTSFMLAAGALTSFVTNKQPTQSIQPHEPKDPQSPTPLSAPIDLR